MGIETNSDGSTNNLPDYFRHCRDKLAKEFFSWLIFYQTFGWVMGIINYAVPAFCLSGAVDGSGRQLDLWNSAAASFIVSCIAYHVSIGFETRYIDKVTIFFQVISLLTIPFISYLNDALEESYYYKLQFDVLYQLPILWLVVVWVIFVAVIPRYVYLCLYYVVWYPEFAKIKPE
mmetsp:Transcript_23944/g.36671  ORF Transcript_23944/g.36671 Transcript_23944/m.36671 type:complete len:175 (+) Transcript_23944:3013-3537(+)